MTQTLRNGIPSLLPDTDPVIGNGAGFSTQTPAQLASSRTAARATINFSGALVAAKTIDVTLTAPVFDGGSYTITATVGAGGGMGFDAADLVAAVINADPLLNAYDILAQPGSEADDETAGAVEIVWPGPLGNLCTLSVVIHDQPALSYEIGEGDVPVENATATATLGGTITADDVVTLTITNPDVPSLVAGHSVAYTVLGTDTLDTIATALAALIMADTTFQAAAITAVAESAAVTISHEGAVGNTSVLTDNVSGAATETVTLTPLSGDLTGGAGSPGDALIGGSGAIVPTENFDWMNGGSVVKFRAGIPVLLDDYTLALLVQTAAHPLTAK